MKFYIGAGLQNHKLASYYSQRLRESGWVHTYDWTGHVSEDFSMEKLTRYAQAEQRGIAEAGVAILLLPGGRGTHIELGMALALGKKVFLCGAVEGFALENTVSFYQLPEITRLSGTADENIQEILAAGR